MPGHADVTHVAAGLCFTRGTQSAVRPQRGLPLQRIDEIVQLQQIDLIHLQALQRTLNLGVRRLVGALAGLGGQKEAIPIAAHPGTDAQFGIAIGRRRVNVVDAVRQEQVEHLVGLGLRA